jgi:LEA14-like dessication related protein
MKRLTLAASLAAIILGTACSSGGTRYVAPPVPFYSPTVALREVKMGSVGLIGGSMDVVLNVYNPNDYMLVSPRVSYRLMVDDLTVGTGVYDSDITVESRDSARVRVPVSFTYKSVRNAGRSAANTGTVNYRVLGHIIVGTPYGRLSAPYDRVGQYAAIALPWPR